MASQQASTANCLHPDTIFYGGQILAMNPTGDRWQAVAVLRRAVAAVGGSEEIKRLAGPRTEMVNLKGKTMLPGFYDAHGHFPNPGLAAVHYANCNSPPMGPAERIDDIVDALREKAAAAPGGEWVLGRGYDDSLLADMRHPTRFDLDRVSAERPVLIQHTSGHFAVANTRALTLAGITRDTPDPQGGIIRRDGGTGEPNGVLEETAMHRVRRLIPPFDEAQWTEGLRHAVSDYASRGVTTVVVAGCDRVGLARQRKAIADGTLTLRLVCMTGKGAPGKPSIQETSGLVTGFGNAMLRLGAVKMFQDGSIQGYTGYLSKPYHTPFMGNPDYRGYPRHSREELAQMVEEAHRAGSQIAVHGNGDAAIDDILHAYEQALSRYPRADARHRIEHCQMAREDQLDRMQELGVTPSFFVQHTFYWGDRHRRLFMGPDRANRMSPLRSALERGVRFTIHNDSPVTSINPLFSVWSAVNRLSRSGRCIGEAQRIPVTEALRSVTADAAWQNFEEEVKGSIEVGKLADFVILDANPLDANPEMIKDIEILETVVGGNSVFHMQEE